MVQIPTVFTEEPKLARRTRKPCLSGLICVSVLCTSMVALGAPDPRLPAAAMNRDIETVASLIKAGADPDSRGEYDTPALHWLVRINELDAARQLLAAVPLRGSDAPLPLR